MHHQSNDPICKAVSTSQSDHVPKKQTGEHRVPELHLLELHFFLADVTASQFSQLQMVFTLPKQYCGNIETSSNFAFMALSDGVYCLQCN